MTPNRNKARMATGATLLVTAGLVAATTLTGDEDAALAQEVIPLDGRAFALASGFDGESKDENHDKWMDVVDLKWNAVWPRKRSGALRRRGDVVVGDLSLTVEYDKASPKLQEKCLKGEIIPKLEIEQTAQFREGLQTYLRYELVGVRVSEFEVVGGSGKGPHMTNVLLDFEQVTVTYTEYDDTGSSAGNVEFTYHSD